MRRLAIVAVGIAVAAVTLTGCDKTSSQCDNGSCEVSVSGLPDVDLGPSHSPSSYGGGQSATSFHIDGYEGQSVEISSGGDSATVQTGHTQRIGELTFTVKSVDGQSAKLHVEQ